MSTFTGSDNPDSATGSYSVDNIYHDASELEWCNPSNDWFRERYLRWSSAAHTKFVNENRYHSLLLEQNVFSQTSYNFGGGADSNLPWNGLYIAALAEQNRQGFEEVDFIVNEPKAILAGTIYYGHLQWEQEADNGILDNSPLLNKVETKVQWTDDLLRSYNYDIIGRWYKKIKDNA